MANKYWVGGTGAWSDDTNHWALSSGGAPGAGNLPTAVDDVFFDTLSSGAGYTLTIDTTTKLCRDITFSAPATGNVTWAGSVAMQVSGSMALYAGLVRTYNGIITFNSAVTGNTVNLAGISLGGSVSFNNTTGGWTLLSNFTSTSGFDFSRGTFNTGNFNISCSSFSGLGATSQASTVLTLGSSIITATLSAGFQGAGTANLGSSTINCTSVITGASTVINAGTSVIKVTGTGSFGGAGKTFNEVQLNGTSHTITGSNTFSQLLISPGRTITFTAGTTQSITTPVFTGTLGNVIILQSSVAGTRFNIVKLGGGSVTADYCNIKDSSVAPDLKWLATNSVDSGNNLGWYFGSIPTISNPKFFF